MMVGRLTRIRWARRATVWYCRPHILSKQETGVSVLLFVVTRELRPGYQELGNEAEEGEAL